MRWSGNGLCLAVGGPGVTAWGSSLRLTLSRSTSGVKRSVGQLFTGCLGNSPFNLYNSSNSWKGNNLELSSLISQLFEESEKLLAIRNNLRKMVEVPEGQNDQHRLSLVIKDIDSIRLTVLYEYELLDTSRIVQDEFIHLYYGRRLEILRLSREQIRGHYDGLEGLCGGITDKQDLREIDNAKEIVQSSLQLFDDIIRTLEQDILIEAERQTRH